VIPPKANNHPLNIRFNARVSIEQTARLSLVSRSNESVAKAAALVFDLKSLVDEKFDEQVYEMTSPLYENSY
jgi:hypothetical protein